MAKYTWLNYLGIIFGCLVLVGAGFYFGYKSRQIQLDRPVANNTVSAEPGATTTKIVAKEIPGIFWIKPGMTPSCPKDYEIKGRFDNVANVYYTPESKTYGRIKPDICFATEETARDTAGFIKRF
jgi:hypothetical protein